MTLQEKIGVDLKAAMKAKDAAAKRGIRAIKAQLLLSLIHISEPTRPY